MQEDVLSKVLKYAVLNLWKVVVKTFYLENQYQLHIRVDHCYVNYSKIK